MSMMADEIYRNLTHHGKSELYELRGGKDVELAKDEAAERYVKLYEWHRQVRDLLLHSPVKPQAGVIKYIEVLEAIIEGKT